MCFSFTVPKNNKENSNNTISNGISEDGNNNKNNNNNKINQSNGLIVVNQKDMADRKPLHLNDLRAADGSEIIIDLLFIRFKKLFFVMKHSSKPLKANLSELLSY